MLAGLLFAIDDAEDRPGRLTATLPFAGVTLIEYQARLLVAAGAAQIIVVVARLTPELLGAIARIGQRGVVVDAVRSAAETVEKLHPLSRLVMLADGLVASEATVAALAQEGGDALLVVPEVDAQAGLERVGGQMAWAGVARLDPKRVAEVAALPRDYDLQSTLLRMAAQARATHVLVPAEAIRAGHGVVRDGRMLDERSRAVLAALVSGRRSGFDRWLLAPIARVALPRLVARGVGSAVVGGAGATLGVAGCAAILMGAPVAGLFLALIGCLGLGLGRTLSDLRDEAGQPRLMDGAMAAVPAVAVLALGWMLREMRGDDVPLLLALFLVVSGALAARAVVERARRRWWAVPAAYLPVVLIPALLGLPVFGLVLACGYAVASLASAIETLRAQA
ncbi:hypothetical protein [Sphingomonas sp.]|uniref:hypothetical protein n=1 Tax=Sphingomonas sp. TaxID=28214 RepID=UPI0035AE9A9E